MATVWTLSIDVVGGIEPRVQQRILNRAKSIRTQTGTGSEPVIAMTPNYDDNFIAAHIRYIGDRIAEAMRWYMKDVASYTNPNTSAAYVPLSYTIANNKVTNIEYNVLEPDNFDTSTYPMISRQIEEAIVHGLIYNWYITHGMEKDAAYEMAMYEDGINQIQKMLNARTQLYTRQYKYYP